MTLTGSDTLANYIAALQSVEFSHGSENPSTAQRTITWTVNDGDSNSNTQNTTADVTAVNDAPINTVAVGAVTDEDMPLTINDASITDVDANPDDVQITLNVTSGTVALDPAATGALATLTGDGTATVVATGTVAEINAALSGMVFTPTPDFSGTASIQMVTDDLGNNPSGAITDTDSFNITVNNLNDAPVLTVTGAPTFAENGSAVAIASSANITDVDDTNIESATITITNVQTGDVLNFVNTPNITGNFAAGVLTLTGSDTKAAYIAALQSITFSNASDNPSITQRLLTWVVNDGNINSNTQNTTIDVTATNDAPVNTVAVGVTTNEDTPVVINGASIADPDADPDDVQITLNVTGGTVALDPTATGALATLTGDGSATVVATGTVAEINVALSGMTFTPTPDSNLNTVSAAIQMVTDDLGNNPSGAITDTDSFGITVNAVNDPPSFTPGTDITVPEDAGNVISPNWAMNRSKGPADENGQVLTFTATVTGTTGTLTFQTAPAVNATTGTLTFRANDNTCGTATVDIFLTDDAGTPGVPGDDLSGPTHTLNLIIQCVNDTPSFTKGPDQTVDEDAAAQTINPWATAISPGPGETDALTFNVSNDNNALFTAGGQPAVSPTGVLTYTPAPNANGTTIVTVTLTDDAGTPGVPGDDVTTAPQTFNITINAVNDAPSFSIAGDPPFVVLGSGAQTVNGYATSITDGDPELTQVLTFNLSQTANSGTLAFDVAPAIDPSTGNLTYTPSAGTHGTVTFSVTLSDNGSNTAPNVNVSGAQSFTIAVEKAPEVTTTVPVNGATGVSTSTNITVNFDEPVSVTLVPASFKINCNAGADLAFAYVGGTTNVTTVTLDPTATLPAGNCVVTVVANEVHDTDAYDPPDGLAADYVFSFVTNTPPTAVDDNATALGHVTLTVADGAGVLGNDTDPDAGADMDIQNFGTPITTTQGGTITFTKEGGYTYNSQALDQNITDTVNYTVTDQFGGTDVGQLSINLGPRFIYVDDDHPTVTPDGRDIHPWKTLQQAQANSAAGDTILVKSGTYTDFIVLQANQRLIGQGIAANLTQLHNAVNFTVLTTGAAPSLSRATAGDTITLGANNVIRGVAIGASNGRGVVGNAFTSVTISESSISTTGGAALDLTTGAATITLSSTSSTNSTGTGVNLVGITGSVDLGTGSITNPTGIAFNATGGTAAITYAGNVSAGGAGAVVIATRAAGSGNVTLSGTITGSANGIGINVNNVTVGTVTFSGAKNLSTGANAGVSLSTNTGGTIVFSGGALAITTTTGTGFTATAGGTVTVLGAANTINTTGAASAALNLNAVTMSAGNGVTFNSVSAGATTVTGVSLTGLLGTGGVTINGGTNSAVTGVALSTMGTVGTSLNNLTINGTTGITGVAGFGTLTVSGVTVSAGNQALSLATGTVNGTFTSVGATGNGNVSPVFLGAVAGTFTVSGGAVADAGAANTVFHVIGGTAAITWNGTLTQGNAAALVDVSGTHTGSLTFGANLTASAGTGFVFNDADGIYNINGATNNLTGGARISITGGSAGTFSFSAGTSVTNATANAAFAFDTSTGGVTYSGNITQTGAQRAVSINNQASGTITFQTNTIACNTSCTGIVLSNADGTVNFNGTNTLNGANAGIDIDTGSGGTFSFASTSSVTTTADIAFRMNGSQPTSMTYGGTLTNNSGRAVEVSYTAAATGNCGAATNFNGNITSNGASASGIFIDRCSGGTIGFSGATKTLNTAGNNAVTISTNGATVNFTNGGLDIDTTSGTGFTAAGGGTVTVQTGGNPNSILTLTGTALTMNATQIGAAGMTFRSINTDGNDTLPTNSISLVSTGTAGGVTVTGNGGSCTAGTPTCTGGTLQDTAGDAIFLNNTGKHSFGLMRITSNLGSGIRGNTVNGLVVDTCLVTSNGNSAATDESGFDVDELTGTARAGTHPTKIVNSTFSENWEFQIQVTNTTGTLPDLFLDSNVVSSTGASPDTGNLVNVLGSSTANITVAVNAGTYTGNAPATATGMHLDTSGGSMNATVTGGTYTNNNAAVNVSTATTGVLTFEVNGVSATGNRSHALNLFVAASSTGSVSGKFLNNTVGTSGVSGSGSNLGFGIRVQNESTNGAAMPVTVLINGNTVQETTSFNLINVNQGIASGNASPTYATITGNTLGDSGQRGIVFEQNNNVNTTGSAGTACIDASGNNFAGTFVGQAGDGSKFRLRELTGGTFSVRQTSAADIAAQNTNLAVGQISIGGSPDFNGGACPQP